MTGWKREPSILSANVRALLEKSGVISQQTLEAILEMIADDEIVDEEDQRDPDDERDARADYEYDRDR